MQNENILQYESRIWATADLLRGCGFKESDWPKFMMPFFALVMVESRLIRMFEELKIEIGEEAFADIEKEDLIELIRDRGQGYNIYIFEHNKRLADICKNDKSFEIDFEAYLAGFDGETKDLLGVNPGEGDKYLDIRDIIIKLKNKKVLFSYTKVWADIDLKPFNNSEITTLEEHIKRKWADISAETAGEQYTPDDVIALIAEIIASKIEDNDRLLKIYDCSCGGGNMLFGVEDRINEKFSRLTQTFGQDWNDSLYALAKIESRFREDAKIAHGNTLTDDKFYNDEFDVVVANPPYGVSWKGYQNEIENDKTGRFKFTPSISDGQLLFMQHLISKLNPATGMGVVVHNGSTLFSGDAGSAESNIRKWMLDSDIVEAIIQLPTDEFFNTGIYTYLWVLNKQKPASHKDKVMLINASDKFSPLKKSKGSKRKEVDEKNRIEIVETLSAFQDNEYARVFDKEFFYFNKQAIQLTNIDSEGKSIADLLSNQKSLKLDLLNLSINGSVIDELEFSHYDKEKYLSLVECYKEYWDKWPSTLDYKEQHIEICTTDGSRYHFDNDRETIVKTDKSGKATALGCGVISIKTALKKPSKTQGERIVISIEITPDYQKDYEIIPFHRDETANRQAITDFMAKYVTKPFVYLDNVVGVELNFNKVFYKPETLRSVEDILADLKASEESLAELEKGLVL